MRWVVFGALLTGCGAAQVTAETARVGACEETEAAIERAYNAGDLTQNEAFARIDCVRLVCDELHERITEEVE